MKQKIAIMTDTNSGVSPQEAEAKGILLVPMPVIIDSKTYFENVSITQAKFFELLKDGADVSTSQPAPGDLIDIWKTALEKYEKIIYIPMSSGLSSSCVTATALAEDFGGSIFVIDNHRISVSQRQSVLEARHMAELGMDIDEIVSYLEQDSLNASIYITVNTLELLKKSGRVTAAGAAMAAILNLKPVLQIQGGKLDAYRKAMGMKNAMKEMIDALKQDWQTRFSGQKIIIRAAYSGNPDNGRQWSEALQMEFPSLDVGVDPLPISVACHVGDGALGVGIMRDIF